jgi:hypothetical protein
MGYEDQDYTQRQEERILHFPLAQQALLRKRGIIKRRLRMLTTLSTPQVRLAEQMQDRYRLATLEQAARYLDWYYVLMKRWITPEQFHCETGITPPEAAP